MTQHNIHITKNLTDSRVIATNTRILLVEDNRINQVVISSVLSKIGLSVKIAGNGVEALAALNNYPNDASFQLIIMDCQMPEMDGYEATRAIREGKAKEVHRNVPIIAMTANATKGDREKCLAVGMNDYATKPLDAEVLYDKIAILLSSDSRTLLSKKAIKTEIDTNKKSAIDNIEKCNHLALNQGIIWDKTGFLKRISHNEVLTKQLVNMFIDDMPELINELLQAMNNEFFDEIVTQAHKISGSSKNLGGVNLAKLAQQIEQSAKTQNSEKIKSLKKELSWAFDMLIQTLEKFLSGKVINDQHTNEE